MTSVTVILCVDISAFMIWSSWSIFITLKFKTNLVDKLKSYLILSNVIYTNSQRKYALWDNVLKFADENW
jgi:hypothetical protein